MNKRHNVHIIELNDNSIFVRARTNQPTAQQVENTARQRGTHTDCFHIWNLIATVGIRQIHYPESFQSLTKQDAEMIKRAVIESTRLIGRTVLNQYSSLRRSAV